MATIALQLDWPPSANTYYRRSGHIMYLSAKGKLFKESVGGQCMVEGVRPLEGRLAVQIELWPPTQRKVDIDNRIKPTLDALIGWCYHDDEQVDRLVVIRREVVKYGACQVIVAKIEAPQNSRK